MVGIYFREYKNIYFYNRQQEISKLHVKSLCQNWPQARFWTHLLTWPGGDRSLILK